MILEAPDTVVAQTPVCQAVQTASAYNRQHGHEIDGFLSFEHGFLPEEPPLLVLPDAYQVWDNLVSELPRLHKTLILRRTFDQLPVLNANDTDSLPDRYLWRASTLLGILAHLYYYVQTDPPQQLPDCILKPWQAVALRMGRPMPYLAYADLFMYNWRLKDRQGARALNNM